MNPLAEIEQFPDHLFSAHFSNDVNVYIVGSRRRANSSSFNSELSDIDLLINSDCKSLDDYVNQLQRAANLGDQLGKIGHTVDIFFLSRELSEHYFCYLSVIWGFRKLDARDIIFGEEFDYPVKPIISSSTIRAEIYTSAAFEFCCRYSKELPFSETKYARRVAKRILRGLKVLACAFTPYSELEKKERVLFYSNDFNSVFNHLEEGFHISKDSLNCFNDALQGDVADWSLWMTAQYEMSTALKEVCERLESAPLYDDLVRVWNMLTLQLKDVLLKGVKDREKSIESYSNEASSLVVRLALEGVETLINFETKQTPKKIKQAYDVIAEFLEVDGKVTYRQLGASILLLEYAFTETLIYLNSNN